MADQFQLPPGATAVTPDASQDTGSSTAVQQFALPPGATPVDSSVPASNGVTSIAALTPPTATQQPQQGFMTGLLSRAKQAWVDGQAQRDAETQVVKDVTDALKKGDYGTAAEHLLDHLAHGAKDIYQDQKSRFQEDYQNAKANLTQLDPLNHGVPFDPQHPEKSQVYAQPIFPMGGPLRLAPEAEEFAASRSAVTPVEATVAKVPGAADFNAASKPSLAQQVEGETAATPAEAATAKAVAKSKLPVGSPATVAPTGEDIQPTLHQGIRDFVNNTHNDAGLPPVPDTTSVLDVPQQSADAFQARSQSTFKQVEDITKVNPTTLRDIMSARADQIENFLAAGKDEEAGNLQQLQLNDENRMAKAFNDAKAKGVDVEQARSDWNKSLRADELSSAVRSSKSSTSTLANPEIDPSKLTPKLQKLYESQPGGKTAKLSQLGGDDNATNLVETAENARGLTAAIKDFEPTSATGQKAMQDILRPHTGSRVVGTGMKTNFLKSLADFEQMSPADQAERFPGAGEVEQARSYLKSQARWQVGKRIAAGVGITAIASSLGVTGAIIRTLME
jgi:hypothetical protein